jgi:RNA polymerase sigma factor (sigma-70 family)
MIVLKPTDHSTAQLDDTTVIQRIIAGEKALFEILLRRYNQTLYRVIRSYLKDESEVQDAMQNTYLKAFDKLYQFHGNAAFSTWLIRIGMNEALGRLKDKKKQKLIFLNPAEITSDINQIADKQMTPEKIIIRHEAQRMLEKAIDGLPEKYRVIYVLKVIEGLPNEQIAESLDLTDSNIKVRLHRAKALLKNNLYKLSSTAEVFEFGNSRCDAVVDFVMKTI